MASDTSVQISARVSNVAVPGVATLRVLAPVLVSLAINPPSAAGGASQLRLLYEPFSILSPMGIVTMNEPASTQGVSVVLASSDPAATVPSSVVILPADGRFGYFPITTRTVLVTTVAEISARLGTTTQSRRLTIVLK